MGSFGKKMKQSEDILMKLDELDLMCESNGIKAEILVLGGAGLMLLLELHDREFRPTRDIDINLLSSTNESGIRKILKQIAIDVIDGVIEVPPLEDFRDKEKLKIENAGFQYIKVFVPTLELLACTKIFSKREKDLQDIRDTDLLILCDKEELVNLVNEYKDYLLNVNDPDLNLHQLENIFKQKGI